MHYLDAIIFILITVVLEGIIIYYPAHVLTLGIFICGVGMWISDYA